MTNHGIYVGMKENEIVNAYGDCHKKIVIHVVIVTKIIN